MTALPPPGPGPVFPDPGHLPDPEFIAVEDWVEEYFIPVFRRPLGGEFRWCARWWAHEEAVLILICLWHSWEVFRLEPGTGMMTWLRDCLQPELPVLMGRMGPFCQCTEREHMALNPARIIAPPPGWLSGGPSGAAA